MLEGTLWARVGDQEVELPKGSYLWKPRGVLHTFWNPGPEPARILETISPGGFENFFEELAVLLQDPTPPSEDVVYELCEHYGLVKQAAARREEAGSNRGTRVGWVLVACAVLVGGWAVQQGIVDGPPAVRAAPVEQPVATGETSAPGAGPVDRRQADGRATLELLTALRVEPQRPVVPGYERSAPPAPGASSGSVGLTSTVRVATPATSSLPGTCALSASSLPPCPLCPTCMPIA